MDERPSRAVPSGWRGGVASATYITCGLAFSGKSSAARHVAAELRVEIVSLDSINHERGLRGGEGIPVEEWERTSYIAMARVEAMLTAGKSVLVDDTFSRRFLRDRCRAVAGACGARFVILYMDTPLDVIHARRAENDRRPTRHHVRDEVFTAHQESFQRPQPDEGAVRIADEASLDAWLTEERAASRDRAA